MVKPHAPELEMRADEPNFYMARTKYGIASREMGEGRIDSGLVEVIKIGLSEKQSVNSLLEQAAERIAHAAMKSIDPSGATASA